MTVYIVVGNSWGTDPDGRQCVGCGPQEQFYGCSDISISATGGATTKTSGTTINKSTLKKTTGTTPGGVTGTRRKITPTVSLSSMITSSTLKVTSSQSTVSTSSPTPSTIPLETTSSQSTVSTSSPTRDTSPIEARSSRSRAFTSSPTPSSIPLESTSSKSTVSTSSSATPSKPSATPAPSGCRAKKWFKPLGGDTYCRQNCPRFCPSSHCLCGADSEPRCKPTITYSNVAGMQRWCEANCAAGFCPRTHCVCGTPST